MSEFFDPNELLLGFVQWCAELDDPWGDGRVQNLQDVARKAENILAAYEKLNEAHRAAFRLGGAPEHVAYVKFDKTYTEGLDCRDPHGC